MRLRCIEHSGAAAYRPNGGAHASPFLVSDCPGEAPARHVIRDVHDEGLVNGRTTRATYAHMLGAQGMAGAQGTAGKGPLPWPCR